MNTEQIEILLVEDNLNDAEMTIRALKEKKISNKLMHLKDGAEALDYIFSEGIYSDRNSNSIPSLILLDINMPKVNGLEVLRKIRANQRTALIPVVILTSSHEERDLFEGYKLGVNSYIVKPLEFNKFMDAVSEIGIYWLTLNKCTHGEATCKA